MLLLNKIFRRQSIRKDLSSSIPPPQMPLKEVSPSWKLYQFITELPLNRFVDACVDKNYAALIREGMPPADVLLKTWEEIRVQYADAIGDHEYRLYISLYKEITIYQCTLGQINMLCTILASVHNDIYALELNNLVSSSFQFDPRFPEDYDRDLKRAQARSMGIKMQMDLKSAQLQAIQGRFEGKNSKPTREYFLGMTDMLSDAVGYSLPESMTVFSFCDRLKKLNERYEKSKIVRHG